MQRGKDARKDLLNLSLSATTQWKPRKKHLTLRNKSDGRSLNLPHEAARSRADGVMGCSRKRLKFLADWMEEALEDCLLWPGPPAEEAMEEGLGLLLAGAEDASELKETDDMLAYWFWDKPLWSHCS